LALERSSLDARAAREKITSRSASAIEASRFTDGLYLVQRLQKLGIAR
jgi:hypothetical protein